MAVTTISSAQAFRNEISKDTLTIVDFWAEWCGPCRMVSPTIDELSEDFKEKASFFKLNVDDVQEVAVELGILSIPTIVFFRAGKEIKRTIGASSKEVYVKEINAAL